METTTIALDREAYEALRHAKKSGESFSTTVKRLAGTRKTLVEFAGSWDHLSASEIEAMRADLLGRRAAARERSRNMRLRRSVG